MDLNGVYHLERLFLFSLSLPNAFLHEIHPHERFLRTLSGLVAMEDEAQDTIQNEPIHLIFSNSFY